MKLKIKQNVVVLCYGRNIWNIPHQSANGVDNEFLWTSDGLYSCIRTFSVLGSVVHDFIGSKTNANSNTYD